jgi:hypothetical protein
MPGWKRPPEWEGFDWIVCCRCIMDDSQECMNYEVMKLGHTIYARRLLVAGYIASMIV